ncbi:MAG: 2-oxoacid:acceptor oxidoreductase family protein [archaeon]
MVEQKVVVAGFGGQGILLIGRLLARAAMLEGHHITWISSYGPEMRGGTANCSVVISRKEIGSPLVPNPDAAIVMNLPSFDKFAPCVKRGGILLIDGSLVTRKSPRKDISQFTVNANDIAKGLGDPIAANMVMLGAYLKLTKAVSLSSVMKAMKEMLPPHRQKLIPLNKKAVEAGMGAV